MRQLQLRKTSFSNQNDVINMAVADEDIDSLKGLASATDSFPINLRSIGYSLNAKMRENGLVEEISLASSDGGTRHTIKNEFLKDAPELPEFKTKDMLADALSKDNVRKYWGFDLVKDGAETKIKFSDKYAQYLYSGLADIFGKNHKILSLNGKDAGSLSESGMKKILDDAETIDISFLAGGKQIAHSFRRLTGGEMQMLFIAMRTNYDPRGFFEDN